MLLCCRCPRAAGRAAALPGRPAGDAGGARAGAAGLLPAARRGGARVLARPGQAGPLPDGAPQGAEAQARAVAPLLVVLVLAAARHGKRLGLRQVDGTAYPPGARCAHSPATR